MNDFAIVFEQLRAIMLAAAGDRVIAHDRPGDLVIHEDRVDPKSGKPVWFGAVTTKKGYVAFHLIPLYTNPALGDGLSGSLAKRRQGKSCFNFKTVDGQLFEELAALAARAADL